MAHPSSAPARGLPPLAWVGIVSGVVLIVVLVTLLALQLAVLTDAREHIRSQDAKITTLYNAVQPAARDVKPLVRQARPALRDAAELVGRLRGEAPELSAAAEAVPPLLDATTALADEGIPLARELRAVLAEVRSEDLVGTTARTARDTPPLLRRLIRIQLATLDTQRRTLRTQRASLRIQRTTLGWTKRAARAAESLDRKTGGQVTPPVPTAAP